MGVLHSAVILERNDMVELLLMAEATDINLMSSLHGTPLHLAAKIGNLKIVQQLLMNGADITIKSMKNGKLAKDNTDSQRVIFLIEKYEQLRALEAEAGASPEEVFEDDDDESIEISTSFGKRMISQAQLGSALSSLVMVDEDEKESEHFKASFLE